MVHIDIICAGRIKEAHYQAACLEYSKRLGAFCKLSISEQPESRPLKIPADNTFTIALCPNGKQCTSEAFSAELWQRVDSGTSKIRFLIGGSDGLYPQDYAHADITLSLSKMTFTHAMARVLLLEQLYRACAIRAGKKYHK